MVTIDPYQKLANAIIVTASRDYMSAYKKFLRSGEGYEKVMREEKFFYTEWFSILSDANPDYLIEAMRKKCEMQVEEDMTLDITDGHSDEDMTLSLTDGHSEHEEDE